MKPVMCVFQILLLHNLTAMQMFKDCLCYSSFLASSFSCPPKATHSSGTHLKSTKKEMLSFRKCHMFLNITSFSSGLFCYPKGVMWYVDLVLLCCVCGSLLMLAWGAVPSGG